VSTLAPLPFAVPVLVAAALAGTSGLIRQRGAEIAGTLTALAVTVLCALLLAHVWHGDEIYWFSGWRPRDGVAIGISFTIDPLGAGMATLAALLVTSALVYSWRYFDALAPLFHVLMLMFLAGMTAFCLTGDLFNMFVLFELMGVSAYALTAYKSEERGPLQGALNFAITNSLGAFMTLTGLALLYGRTGALNLAQMGHALAGHHVDGLVVVAFVLVCTGFLVKAAAVPFHFWLADAHAVAPVPVCVLFSGVMVQLGLYAVARVYWTVFSGALPPTGNALHVVLVVLGAVGAVVGAVMCLEQRHLKRLLAYSTISHSGMFLIGIGLLGSAGIAASALFVLAHGLVKAAMFMLTGILGHRLGSVDEHDLHGRGRELRGTGALYGVGALALASLPPFGPFLGKALTDDAAHAHGYWWVAPLLALVSALTGGAILRAGARVFLGWGVPERDARDEEAAAEEPETRGRHDRTPLPMLTPPIVLLLGGLAVGLIPRLHHGVERAAERFVDRAGVAGRVLGTHAPPLAHHAVHPISGAAYAWGIVSVLGALLVAWLGLWMPQLRRRVAPAWQAPGARALGVLRAAHSGHVGDYVAWLVLGVAAFGGAVALAAP
jgi:multicomponent Na+:H+ antiporter subunit D